MFIHFEDHGQDFLEWELDRTGKVINSTPFQPWNWINKQVINHDRLVIGGIVHIRDEFGEETTIKYPVEHISQSV